MVEQSQQILCQVILKLVSGPGRPFRLKGMIQVGDISVNKATREAVVNKPGYL